MARRLAAAIAFNLALTALPALAADIPKAEIDLLKRRVEQASASADAHFDLAMGYARTPELEKGFECLKKVQELDAGYHEKIINTYSPLVTENPSNIEAQFRLAFGYYYQGVILGQEGKTGEAAAHRAMAKQAFERIINVDPQYVWGYNYLAYLIAEENDLPKAAEILKTAIAKDPDNAVSHFLLGHAYHRMGQKMEAMMELAQAMRLRALR